MNSTRIYVMIPAGSVEYSKDAAATPIDEFIAQLQQARQDGATHVVGLSGNYRGAQYVALGDPEIDEDEEEFVDDGE